MTTLAVFQDDGVTILTTINKQVFVSAERVGEYIYIVVNQQAYIKKPPEPHTYKVLIKANEHLLQILNW